MSFGLLLIRLVVGLTMAGHGTQKLFGWFGGHGIKGTSGWFDSMGMKPGWLMALIAALAEFIGGLLFALGLWLPIAAIIIGITMLVAIVTVHGKNGYWVTKNGFEYNLTIIAIVVGVALVGPGVYAV